MTLEQEVLELVAKHADGIRLGDRELIDGILADEFFSVDPSGGRRTKQEYMDFCFSNLSEEMDVDLSNITVTPLSDEVVAFDADAKMGPHPFAPPDDPYIYIRMLVVIAKRDGPWQYVVQQGTPMPRQ